MKILQLLKEAKEILADFAKTRGEGAAFAISELLFTV
jgi:hypothetical protein